MDWYVEADPVKALAYARSAGPCRDEHRANSLGVVMTAALLFVLLSATLMVGGHVVVGPILRQAAAAREARSLADVVYTMPDGLFCRRASFDNATGEIVEGGLQHCPHSVGRVAAGASKFEWGGH